MDKNGQVYFGPANELPREDVERLREAFLAEERVALAAERESVALRERIAAKAAAERAQLLRDMDNE